MKKPSPLKRWLTLQVAEAIRLPKLGATVMLPVSAAVGLLSICFFYTAIWLLTDDLPKFLNFLYAVLFVGGQFVVYGLLVRQDIASNYDYPDGSDGGRFASWLWLLFLPAPRLLFLALECKALATRLEQLDVGACTKAVNMVMKAQGRVLVEDVAKKYPKIDEDLLVRWLADIDGVVIVRRQGLGLTVTPTFTEEYQRWFGQNSDQSSDDDDDLL